MPKRSVSRRTALKILALAAAGTAVMADRRTVGAEPIKLEMSDPAALALGYVENAAMVDVNKYPAFVPGSNCDNCLQLQGAPGPDYRPCGLFPGKLVAARGWCSGWTAEI